MAGRNAIIKAIITADATGLVSALERTERRMGELGATMTRRLTLPLAAAGVAAFKMGSDLEEATSQAEQVFGAGARDIIAAAGNLEDAFSETEFLSFASNVGDIAQGMGIAQSEADDLAVSVLSLGQDLASFKNLPTERAIGAITSALTGEREALKSLGIVINEQMVQQQALAMGLADSTGAIDQQAKAQATMALITEAAANAIGDFDRTADGAANQTRILVANFKDTAAELGTNLLPLGQKLLEWANKVVTAFGNLSPEMQQMVVVGAGIVAAMGPLLTVLSKARTAVMALGTSITFLAAHPMVALLGVLAAAGVALWWHSRSVDSTADNYRRAAQELADYEAMVEGLARTLDQQTRATTTATAEMIAGELAAAGLGEGFAAAGLTGQTLIDRMERLAGYAASGASMGQLGRSVQGLAREFGILELQTLEGEDAFLRLVFALANSKTQARTVDTLMGDLGDEVGDLAGVTADLVDNWGDLTDEFLSSMQVEASTRQLVDDIAAAVQGLDDKTLAEVQQEAIDFTSRFAELRQEAQDTQTKGLEPLFAQAEYGLALLVTQGELSEQQMQDLFDLLDLIDKMVVRPTLEMPSFTGHAGPSGFDVSLPADPAGASVGGSSKGQTVVVQIDGEAVAQAVVNADRRTGGVMIP